MNTAFDYYLCGSSGRWGFHHSEGCGVITVGYSGDEILEAMQDVFGFEGRNAGLIEKLGIEERRPHRWLGKRFGINHHTKREARLYRRLADRLQQDPPDTRADWDPDTLFKPPQPTVGEMMSLEETLQRRRLKPYPIRADKMPDLSN
jgi:hypothetical protein